MCRLILAGMLCLILSGCLYSHTVEPLTTNFSSTPTGEERSSGDIKAAAFYVSVEWDENGIGTIAKKYGIEEIYYADIETTRVFRYWKRERIHIYGR